MAEVLIFRHGPAEERDPRRWPDDNERPLTEQGTRATRRAAKGLARLVPHVDLIATSPATRALKTAELLEKALECSRPMELWKELSSGHVAPPLLERVQVRARRSPKIVLVGHEPMLGEFLGLAMTGEAVSLQRLTKGGAGALEFPRSVRPSAGRLQWLLTRKQLMALGR